MRKLLISLPSMKFIAITVIVCLVLGVICAGGFQAEALLGLVLALGFIILITIRNSDPMAWEAYHEPHMHSMRLQRDALANQLEAVVTTYESGDRAAMDEVNAHARELLADLRSTTTAR